MGEGRCHSRATILRVPERVPAAGRTTMGARGEDVGGNYGVPTFLGVHERLPDATWTIMAETGGGWAQAPYTP